MTTSQAAVPQNGGEADNHGWHRMDEVPPHNGGYLVTVIGEFDGFRKLECGSYIDGEWHSFVYATQIAWMEYPPPADFVVGYQHNERQDSQP